jgi:hypothetical protein
MALAFSSPGGIVSTQGANQANRAAFASAASHPGKNFMLSGSNMATSKQKLKVAVPFTADDKVNCTPALSMLLKTCNYLDTNSCLKSNDPLFSSIENANNVAKISNIEKYVSDLQTNVQKRQFVYFVTLETTISFFDLKYNKAMFSWLRENQHYISPHSMNTNYVTPIGLFSGLHPTLSSRDNMKVLLAKPLDGIEYALVTASTFFIDKDGKKVNTNVVEIHVASESADRAREHLSIAWENETFLSELESRTNGQPIMFIPSIQHGVMTVETYREALSQQHEQAKNTVSISVEGIAGLDAGIRLRNGDTTMFSKLILALEDSNGKKLFKGIELMKFTQDQGGYLFLLMKSALDEAEAQFDKLTMDLANEGLLNALQIEGMFIRHCSQIQWKPVSSYAERLKAKFKPPVPTMSTQPSGPQPTCNAWNRTPTLKKGQDNIPEIPTPSRHHTQKKQHTKSGSNGTAANDSSLSPPSLGTTQTELTDERTEMQAMLTYMQNTFATEINKIKGQTEQLEKKLADRVEKSKKDYQTAKDIMLKEFKHAEEKHGQYLTAVATLGDEFHKNTIETNRHYMEMEKRQTETDQRLCAMMEILSTIHQSLATGERPNALTQDQINNFVSPRDGAPSSSNTTKCSSTDLQEGAQQL